MLLAQHREGALLQWLPAEVVTNVLPHFGLADLRRHPEHRTTGDLAALGGVIDDEPILVFVARARGVGLEAADRLRAPEHGVNVLGLRDALRGVDGHGITVGKPDRAVFLLDLLPSDQALSAGAVAQHDPLSGHGADLSLFRTAAGKTGILTRSAMHRIDAYRMIRRRTADAGFKVKLGCHTFRATGLTAYLEAGGTLENAQAMAAHESPRTTKLYDRTGDKITLDEVERITI